MMAKVLIVDDNEYTRVGVRSILDHSPHIPYECEGLDDLERAIEHAGGTIDVALIDLLLEGHRTGLDVMEKLDARRPRPKLVVLTSGETMSRPQLLCRAQLRYGLDGALPKRRASKDLPASIDKVCSGERAFHPDLVPYLAREISIDPLLAEKSHASLWVALALGFGGGHRDLAKVTQLSKKYVGTTITEMRRKLSDLGFVGEEELPQDARSGVLAALARFAASYREYILYWASTNQDRFWLAPIGQNRLDQYEHGEI